MTTGQEATMTQITFRKDIDGSGGWVFDTRDGGTFMARRREDGWALFEGYGMQAAGSATGTDWTWELIRDQFASRKDAAEFALAEVAAYQQIMADRDDVIVLRIG
jgi:hypothetical protein